MDRSFSSTELYTWNFLEDNEDKVQSMTITKLASISHVSAATIERTLKKGGYDGYSDYKSSKKNRPHYILKESGFSVVAQELIEKNREEVNRTIDLLVPGDIEEIVHLIHKSQNIYIMSAGPTKSVANYFASKLQLSGKSCIALDDKDYMLFYANKMGREDLLLILSLYGETEEIILAGEIAKKNHANMVTLTSEGESTLAQQADYKMICYKSHLKKFGMTTDTASRISLEIIARVLLDMWSIYKNLGNITGAK